MRNIASELAQTIDGWLAPFLFLAAAFIGVALLRIVLQKIGKARNFVSIRELAPSLANLLYVVGLKAFADAAPLPPKIDSWIEAGIYVVGAFIVLGLVRRAALMMIEWGVVHANPSVKLQQQGFIPLFQNLITLFVFMMGAIMILKHFNYDVMSLITALGVGSLAVGLASKDTLSNMISGFTLIIDRNLTPGDRVSLGTVTGDVEEIGLRSTRINTGGGNTWIVPNSDLVNTKILNLSQPSRAMACSTKFRIPFDVPFTPVKQASLEVMNTIEFVSKELGKWVIINTLEQGCQLITAGFWIEDINNEGAAISEFNEKVQVKLKALGVPLLGPVPPVA